MPDSPLRQAALETEAYVGGQGWDQPWRLFSLVSTVALRESEPGLADQLVGDGFTPVEQERPADGRTLEDLLAEIHWPPTVEGCAVVMESMLLPPEAQESLPADPAEAAAAAAAHPDRRDVRVAAAVLRDGQAHCTVRAREPETAELLEGPDLVPGLVAQLRSTLEG